MATGLRIGWAMVNRHSVVSSAMIVALGSLAIVAALSWPPVTLLVDAARANISVGLIQVALIASAAGSCVMITSVASTRHSSVTRRLAVIQYCVAALIAVVSLVLFFSGQRQPEMTPREYLARNLGSGTTAMHWLVPLLYVLLVLTLACWVGMRVANPSRRGRALFIFTVGIALIVAASAFFLIRAVGSTELVGVGTAATLLMCAMAIVAAGSLLPTVEDWFDARRELRLIAPLRLELGRRHPDIGIGVRPRGPLVFRVAEQLSLISDSLYLEASAAKPAAQVGVSEPPSSVSGPERALAVARWVRTGSGAGPDSFPGRGWLRQPPNYSDREWILEIARQYRALERDVARPWGDDSAEISTGSATSAGGEA
jgi:hypothetical protein